MNDISRTDIGFDSPDNELVLVTARAERTVTHRSKRACAAALWDAVEVPASTAPTPAGS
jgi:hypothetical protein